MVQVHLTSGMVCSVDRFVTVMFPGDPEGKKTYHVGQIAGAKRRFNHDEVAAIGADWFTQ